MTVRKVGILVTMMIVTMGTYCQVPQAINYQAVARNSNGNALTTKAINIRISIIQGSVTGQTVYQETQSVTTDNAGVFSIKIGMGTATTGLFTQINWSSTNFFIKSEFDFGDGSGFQLSGTSQMLSVPYALYAGNGSKWKIKSDSATFYNSGKVGIGASTPRSILDVISKEGNSQYTLNLSSTHTQGQAGTAAWNDNGGWLKVALLGSQVTGGSAFGQTGEGTIQILSNKGGAKDMLIGTLNNQSLFLGTNNLPRMSILNSGNIGIGTTNPAQALSVNGVIESTTGGIKFPDGTLQISAPISSISSQWRMNSDSSIYYKATSGRVGIGTKTPRSFLDVVSNQGSSQYTLNLSSTHALGQAGSALWNDNGGWLKVALLGSQVTDGAAFGQSGQGTVQILSNSNSGGAKDMLIGTLNDQSLLFGTKNLPRLTVKNDGNVGIGTTTPSQKLDIRGDDAFVNAPLIQLATNSGNHFMTIFSGRTGDPSPFISWKNTDTLKLVSYTDIGLNGYAERMRITPTGAIGIGTKNPTNKLDVRGATPDDGTLITVSNSDQSHALWMFGGRQNDPSPFLTWKDTDALRFATISNSSFAGFTERVRISSTGNLGVGTINPKSKVHVTGGDVYVENISSGIIMKSPNGQCWRITISNTGTFTSSAIACP